MTCWMTGGTRNHLDTRYGSSDNRDCERTDKDAGVHRAPGRPLDPARRGRISHQGPVLAHHHRRDPVLGEPVLRWAHEPQPPLNRLAWNALLRGALTSGRALGGLLPRRAARLLRGRLLRSAAPRRRRLLRRARAPRGGLAWASRLRCRLPGASGASTRAGTAARAPGRLARGRTRARATP